MVDALLTPPNDTTAREMPAIAYDLTEGRFGIGRDDLNTAISDLPHGQARTLEWFWRWCSERNVSRSRIAQLLRKPNGDFYSVDTIYQTLSGRRAEQGINVAPICKAIEEFRSGVEPNPKTEGFIETRLAQEVWRYIGRAIKKKKIGLIFGDMSIGKSIAAGEYARRHTDVCYTRMPTRGQLGDYLKECAGKMAMGAYSGVGNLRDRVINGIPNGLIIDEADQCFQSVKNSLGLATLDFIREAYDRKACGIVLIMDHHGRNELMRGHNAARLKRLYRRRLAPLQLPSQIYASDGDAYAASFGLTPARRDEVRVNVKYTDDDGVEHKKLHSESPLELQNRVIAKHGLAVWLMILDDAHDLAQEQRRTITWEAVIKAHALFVAMEEAVSGEAK